MSSAPKPTITAAKLNDVVLGCFSHVKPSPTMDHLVRYLGTWSGSDKFFMVIQYAVKLIAPFLRLRARLQHKAGMRQSAESSGAEALVKFGGIVGDSRTVWRIWGLLPIFQWLISLERSPPATRTLLTIERLQGWSMLVYYPFEHISYLISHGIIPSTFTLPSILSSLLPSSKGSGKRTVKLDANKLSLYSTRAWALYVFLHFLHLWEDRKLLIARARALKKGKGVSAVAEEERRDMSARWDAWWSEVVVNLGYLPLTVHWSLEKGIIKSDVWVGVLGLIAAVASFRSGWKATALPTPPPPHPPAAPSQAVVDEGKKDLEKERQKEEVAAAVNGSGYEL